MNIKIVTKFRGKKLQGVGLGNQVNFIPAILYLRRIGHNVYSDSEFLQAMGACRVSDKRPDRIYIPLAANWKDVLKVRLQFPFTDIRGFTYGIKGKQYSFGYTRALTKNMNMTEYKQISILIPNPFPFGIAGYNPVKGTVVIGYTEKKPYQGDRFYEHWDKLADVLKSMGYFPAFVGDGKRMFNTYAGLIAMIKSSEYFIGVDSGLMHIADIFNVPGFVFWGDTPSKNKPVNLKVIQGLDTIPTEELIRDGFKI